AAPARLKRAVFRLQTAAPRTRTPRQSTTTQLSLVVDAPRQAPCIPVRIIVFIAQTLRTTPTLPLGFRHGLDSIQNVLATARQIVGGSVPGHFVDMKITHLAMRRSRGRLGPGRNSHPTRDEAKPVTRSNQHQHMPWVG